MMLVSEYLIKVSTCESRFESHYEISGGGLHTAKNQIKMPSDLFSFSHIRNASRLDDNRIGALRTASSSEQGVRATVDEQIGKWTQCNTDKRHDSATPELEAGVGTHPGIGLGLPMSNIFAT